MSDNWAAWSGGGEKWKEKCKEEKKEGIHLDWFDGGCIVLSVVVCVKCEGLKVGVALRL